MNNLKLFYLLSCLTFSLVFTNCSKENSILTDPTASEINFTVTGDPEFEQTIYPSVLLGLSNYFGNSKADFFDFKIKNPLVNSNLKIIIEASNINSETIFQTQLANKDAVYSFSPLIKWNYANLKLLKQPGSVDMTFVCYINDKEIDRKNVRLPYRSVNECVYGIIDANGKYNDMKWMFAAYVNEDNPKIDLLLKDVLSNRIVDSFSGYQGGEQAVLDQVSAIWYYLQSESVKYSSITDSSNPSQKVRSQYVRFFDEVYNNSQANCVDGSVFLASILKKIGINPILVIVPGHMYLGFYTTQDKSKLQLLETTMIGLVDQAKIYADTQYVYGLTEYRSYLSDISYSNYFKRLTTLDALKKEISYASFIEAVNNKVEAFNSNISKFNDINNFEYKVFDIGELRKVVQPISSKKLQRIMIIK